MAKQQKRPPRHQRPPFEEPENGETMEELQAAAMDEMAERMGRISEVNRALSRQGIDSPVKATLDEYLEAWSNS